MPSIAGRLCVVKWSPDDITYSTIAGIDSVSDGVAAPPISDLEFGVQWQQNVPGILNNPVSMSGGLRVSDTNGQIAMRTAFINGTFGYLKVLWDGTTNGYKQQMLVTKFAPDTKVSDKTNISIELASQGAITYLP